MVGAEWKDVAHIGLTLVREPPAKSIACRFSSPPYRITDSPRTHRISKWVAGRSPTGTAVDPGTVISSAPSIVVSAPLRHTTDWREGDTAPGDGPRRGIGIHASDHLRCS